MSYHLESKVMQKHLNFQEEIALNGDFKYQIVVRCQIPHKFQILCCCKIMFFLSQYCDILTPQYQLKSYICVLNTPIFTVNKNSKATKHTKYIEHS